MKKLNVVLALIVAVTLSGQDFKYGLTANFHQGSIVGVHDVSVGRFGGTVGAFVQIPLVENDIYDSSWFYLMPQIEYSMQGENANAEREKFGRQVFHHDYLAAQLYLKYFYHQGTYKTNYFAFAGPRFEYLVREKRQVDPAYDAVYYQYNYDKTLNKYGFGISVGVGAKINDQLEGFLRFDRGFSKVYPDNNLNNTYNRQLSVGINYFLSSDR